jgi:hypothetical protein
VAALATTDDVADRWQPLTGSQVRAASAMLDQISALVRLRQPGIDEEMAADVNLAVVVRGTVAGAVLRVLRNPDGKVQESIDDYAYRRADAVADGALYLTDREWASFSPPVVLPGAYVVSLGG